MKLISFNTMTFQYTVAMDGTKMIVALFLNCIFSSQTFLKPFCTTVWAPLLYNERRAAVSDILQEKLERVQNREISVYESDEIIIEIETTIT